MILKDKRFTIDEVNTAMSSFEIDMQAFFDVLQMAVFEQIRFAVDNGLTPEELIGLIENLFADNVQENILIDIAPAVEEVTKALHAAGIKLKDFKFGETIHRKTEKEI